MKNFKAQNSIEHNYFQHHFSSLKDPRRTSKGNYYYPLHEMLLLVISGVLCGYKDWTSIEIFGETKLDWLRRFYKFEHGIPSHDMLGKVFSRLDPEAFCNCFISWVNEISDLTEGEVIAIDGKSICGSNDSIKKKSAIHVVSAYATENRLCLAQIAVDQKENEIIAIPKVLDLLTAKGCIITIDAMGCQKEIAKAIVKKQADYVLMVKENQKELLHQVKKMFDINKNAISSETFDSGHGRVETRKCEVTDNLTFFDDRDCWPGLKSVVRITSTRFIKKTGKESKEQRYYITSLKADPKKLNKVVRAHWGIENNLHWALDVIFEEDKALKKKNNAALNFNIVNKVALAILEKNRSVKLTKPAIRIKAALDDDYREFLIKS